MRSKTYGWQLHAGEIAQAHIAANAMMDVQEMFFPFPRKVT